MWTMLHEFGIKAWNHYSPMHLASSFRSKGMGRVGDCPVAEALFEQYVYTFYPRRRHLSFFIYPSIILTK